MNIEEVNFNDEDVVYLIKKYCLYSAPFGQIGYLNSISSRERSINQYIKVLKNCELAIAAVNGGGDYLFFLFIGETSKKGLSLEFAFPNPCISSNISLMRFCFYNLCLHAMDFFRKEEISGIIRRQNKKNPFKMFLRRYIKAISYTENDEQQYDSVYLTKESILKHREQLKSKSNWD